jgi:hypothetical protein
MVALVSIAGLSLDSTSSCVIIVPDVLLNIVRKILLARQLVP